MQGVEEEVRLKLHPQGADPGLRKLDLQLRRPHFMLARLALILESITHEDDDTVFPQSHNHQKGVAVPE